MAAFNDVLKPFIPKASFEIVSRWLRAYPLQIQISGSRVSKLGDYRSPDGKNGLHKISVNGTLNEYAFLLTFTHEYAHLLCFVKYKNKVKPHGKQWKQIYKGLLFELMDAGIFPAAVEYELMKVILGNVSATFSSEKELQKALSNYNPPDESMMVESLPENARFVLNNKKEFLKGKKIRTRYKCYCLTNKKWYYVSAGARVQPCFEQEIKA